MGVFLSDIICAAGAATLSRCAAAGRLRGAAPVCAIKGNSRRARARLKASSSEKSTALPPARSFSLCFSSASTARRVWARGRQASRPRVRTAVLVRRRRRQHWLGGCGGGGPRLRFGQRSLCRARRALGLALNHAAGRYAVNNKCGGSSRKKGSENRRDYCCGERQYTNWDVAWYSEAVER